MRGSKKAVRPIASAQNPANQPAPSPSPDDAQKATANKSVGHAERFAVWSKRFEDPSYRLPQRPWGAPAIDFNRIANESGIPVGSICKPPYLAVLRQQALKGLKLVSSEIFLPLSLSELVWQGERRFARRYHARPDKTKEQKKSAIANFSSSCRALEKTCAAPSLAARAVVDAAIVSETAKIVPNIKNLACWRSLSDFLEEWEINGGLPAAFGDSIEFLLHRTQWSVTACARTMGLAAPIVYSWIYKGIMPKQKYASAVSQLECELGLPPGVLTGRILRVRRYYTKGRDTSIDPEGKLPQGVLAPFLPPNFNQTSGAEREAMLIEAETFYRRGIDPKEAARIRMRRTPFALTEPSLPLKQEMTSYLAFYSNADLEYGLKRKPAKLWSFSTGRMAKDALYRFIGYTSSDFCKQFNIPSDHFTLALLVFPRLTHAFANWRIERMREYYGEGMIPRTDLKPVSLGRQMVDEFGWLTQRSDLAMRLQPVPARDGSWIVSPEEIAAARSEWPAVCAKARQRYDEQYTSFVPAITTMRNDHAKCLVILKLEDPMTAFRYLIDGLRREAATLHKHTNAYQDTMRDLALVHVEVRCAFREGTLIDLTYRPDNTGHLHADERGRMAIDAPADLFKNEDSPYFVNLDGSVNRFRRVLDYDGAECREDLQHYLRDVRPALVGDGHCDSLLVSRAGAPMTEFDIDSVMRRITRNHLVWNDMTGTGIRGITRPQPLRFFRHVLATGTWKLTGDVQLAADAIADVVETVREHYGRYVPDDRRPRLEAAIAAALQAKRRPR